MQICLSCSEGFVTQTFLYSPFLFEDLESRCHRWNALSSEKQSELAVPFHVLDTSVLPWAENFDLCKSLITAVLFATDSLLTPSSLCCLYSSSVFINEQGKLAGVHDTVTVLNCNNKNGTPAPLAGLQRSYREGMSRLGDSRIAASLILELKDWLRLMNPLPLIAPNDSCQ